jgi:AcrR family transcriptional regulator
MQEAPLSETPSAERSGSGRTGRPARVAVEDIIDVALEIFGTRGLRGTTIGAIASRLGLTDSGVLHYFPTKDALIDAVLERAALEQARQIRSIVEPGGLEALRRFAAWGEVVEQTPELTAFQINLSSEAILHESPIADWVVRRYAAVHDFTTGLIREGIERGEICADVDADWEASALVAFLDGIRLQWFYSGRQLPIADAVRRYVELLVERIARTPEARLP